jgi:NAD(P)-dependent dehydrogenase (short-subunit alcohol dehydrogenase family)
MSSPPSSSSGDLGGRHVLVTGGASGIGFAICRMAIERGAKVAMLDVDAGKVGPPARELGAFPIAADLSDMSMPGPAVAEAVQALGALDGVVNCAGISSPAPLAELNPEAWTRILTVNLTAPYLILRAALPWLSKAANASVVNIASGAGILPSGSKGGSAYASSKAGLLGLTRALASELAPGIRVNAVCPGLTDTPMVRNRTGGPPPASRYALNRAADPSEIAAGVIFLLSDAASYVTGSTLAVDGGRTFH